MDLLGHYWFVGNDGRRESWFVWYSRTRTCYKMGNTLSFKFIGAIFLLLISLVRTLLISHVMAAENRQLTPTGVGILRQFYAGTTILTTLLILLALSLAHGS